MSNRMGAMHSFHINGDPREIRGENTRKEKLGCDRSPSTLAQLPDQVGGHRY